MRICFTLNSKSWFSRFDEFNKHEYRPKEIPPPGGFRKALKEPCGLSRVNVYLFIGNAIEKDHESEGSLHDSHVSNPEISGGHITLIATNNNPVQVRPMSLERMRASLQKQIMFNRRVLKAEDQIAGINSGIGDFLQDMSFDLSDPVFVCVNVAHKGRGSQPVGGQLWTQCGRHMTATNLPLGGLDSSRESVALSAVVEAVAWRHALENASDLSFQRRGQRVIVYPKFLTKLETVLTTGNVGLDMEG
jgi:hypothetical protein